ncbi:MAG: hypothetical protein ABL931_23330, partial [Usitatibacteraceae bacterium]
MTTIEHAAGKFGRPRQRDNVIHVAKLPRAVQESAARAMNEPRFQSQQAPHQAPQQAPQPTPHPHMAHAEGSLSPLLQPADFGRSPRSGDSALKTTVLAVGSMCVGAALMYAWMNTQKSDVATSAKRVEPAAVAFMSDVPPVGTASTRTAAPAAPPIVAPIEERTRAAAIIGQWAAAWSQRDVSAYLGFYAQEFIPPDNLSRDAWQDRRRERIQS